jgi:hypothetical protein
MKLSTLFSFVSLAFTFGLGLLGTLFDYIEKDGHGKHRTGKFGLPKLTTAGGVCVILLAFSFISSCVLTYDTNKSSDESDDRAKKMASDLTQTQQKLTTEQQQVRDVQGQLTLTQRQLAQLQSLDVAEFSKVTTHLKATTHELVQQIDDETTKVTTAMQMSADGVDHKIRGAVTTVKSFWVWLAFLGSPQQEFTRARDEFPSASIFPSGNVQLIKTLTCGSPVPVKVELLVGLTNFLNLSIEASNRNSACAVNTQLGRVRPQYWLQHISEDRTDVISYAAEFTPELLKPLEISDPLTITSFDHGNRATVNIEFESEDEAGRGEEYFSRVLPRVFGLHVLPDQAENTGLQSSRAFVLDSIAAMPNQYQKYNRTYFYEQAPMKSDWAVWSDMGRANPNMHKLTNPYREVTKSGR